MATRNSGIEARLTIDTKPFEQGLDKAKKKLDQTVARMTSNEGVKLRSHDWTKGGGGETFTQSMIRQQKQLYPHLQKTNAELRLQGQLMRSGTGSMIKMQQQANTRAGQGILQLGYAVDDLQYGIKGVANNIPQLVQSFTGGSAKMAGWIGIIVTAGTVLYQLKEEIFEAATGVKVITDEQITEANKKAAESYRELTEKMRETGAEAGRLRAAYISAQVAGQTQTRANFQGFEERDQREADIKDIGRMAAAEKYNPEVKARKQKEIMDAQELRHLNAKLERAKKNAEFDQAELVRLSERLKLEEKELATLKKQEEISKNRNDNSFSGEQAKRLGSLEQTVPALRDAREAVGRRGFEASEEVLNTEQEIRKQQAEMAADRTKENIQAAKDQEKRQEEAQAALRQWFQKGKEVFQKVRDRAQEFAKELAQMAENQGRTRRDLAIGEIRNPRRRERAKRAAQQADRTQELVKQGFDPLEAADIADREQRVADRAAGKRTIRRRAVSQKEAGGLDAFSFEKRGAAAMMADSNVPTPFQASQARGREAVRRQKAEADKLGASTAREGREAVEVLKQMLERMDRLIQATEKTPAERAQPARR
jgi:hypothetical protein